MMVRFGFPYRNDAAVRHFAFDVLKLDGGVIDTEVVVQDLFDIAQDAFAHRGRNVGDGDVTGERMAFRADAPYVQVMDVVDPFDLADGVFQKVTSPASSHALSQHVHSGRVPHGRV